MKAALLTPLVVLLAGTGHASAKAQHPTRMRCRESRHAIVFYRTATWKWQTSSYVTRTPTSSPEKFRHTSCAYLRWAARLWVVRNRHARQRYYAIVNDPIRSIRSTFGRYGDQAVAVAGCETGGTYSVYASNGQYLGLFQMGDYAREKYGHSTSALGQARAAYHYFSDEGYDWSPWECKP